MEIAFRNAVVEGLSGGGGGGGGGGDEPHPETIITYADGSTASIDFSGQIGSWSIPNRENLVVLDLGTDVTDINFGTFQNCSKLVEVKLPDSLESVGNQAFFGCTALKHVVASQAAVDNFRLAFDGYTDLSVDIADGVTSIASWAFHSCSGLGKVTVPDSVTSIGSSAFESCTGLTCLVLGNGLETLDYGAFMKCSALPSVTLPSSVTSINNAVFQGCTSLTAVIFEGKTLAEVKAMTGYPWGISDTSIIHAG